MAVNPNIQKLGNAGMQDLCATFSAGVWQAA